VSVAEQPEPQLQPGWEQHREAQRRAWLRLSYAERLRWLEQAKRFARLALASARRRNAR
jgi:hypothetical protein